MAEFVHVAEQTVENGLNVLLNASIPCNRGYVLHREGGGILTLRGIVNNPYSCFARYHVTFNGNIAIADGGTVDPISVAIAIDGEPVQSSRAIVTPDAALEYNNVTCTCFVTVPRGCCNTIAVENISGQTINVQNANLVVVRTA